MMKNLANKTAIHIFVFMLAALAVYFSFGFHHIGKFMTVDEPHWLYERVPLYWKGMLEQKWKLTYVHEKPGISLTIISGAGLLQYSDPDKNIKKIEPDITGETAAAESFYAAFRLPVLVFNGLFSFLLFWLVYKITRNAWMSLWSQILILFSPVIIGISQIVNSDALVWSFSTATILTYIAYLKTEERKFLCLAPLFLGLSLLTKFVSVILLPFLFVIGIFFCLENIGMWREQKIKFENKIRNITLLYLFSLAGAVAIFGLLMPASLLNPKYLYAGTIGYSGMQFIVWPIILLQIGILMDSIFFQSRYFSSILSTGRNFLSGYARVLCFFLAGSFLLILINYCLGGDFLNLEKIPFDSYQDKIFYENGWIKKMLLELRPLVFSITPLVLISALYLWIKSIGKKTRHAFLTVIISSFIVAFLAAVIQEKLLNIVRYSIVLYPLLAILAAAGIDDLFSTDKLKKTSRVLITLVVLFSGVASLWMTRPFYLGYSNFLLPKNYIISDSWGQGGYEAAKHLNALPDAKNLTVWSDSSGVCEFFVGKCVKGKCQLPKSNEDFDYYVLNRRGEILFKEKEKDDKYCVLLNPHLFSEIAGKYERTDPIFELFINGRPDNFVRIIKD